MGQKHLIILFWITESFLLTGIIIGSCLGAYGFGAVAALGLFPAVSVLSFIPFFIGIKKLKKKTLTFLNISFTFGIYFLFNYLMILAMLSDIILKLNN